MFYLFLDFTIKNKTFCLNLECVNTKNMVDNHMNINYVNKKYILTYVTWKIDNIWHDFYNCALSNFSFYWKVKDMLDFQFIIRGGSLVDTSMLF